MKNSSAVARKSTSVLRDRIRQSREMLGLSRAELAREVGVVASAAAQWEQSEGTTPSLENLAAIAQVTEVSFDWLATGRGYARFRGGHEDLAIHPDSLAMDPFEEEMLALVRKMPQSHRYPFLTYLKAVYPGKR